MYVCFVSFRFVLLFFVCFLFGVGLAVQYIYLFDNNVIGCSSPNSMLLSRRSRYIQLLIQHFKKY